MKKTYAILALLLIANLGFSQSNETTEIKTEEKATVEKSIFGIGIGLVGVWANNEFRLGDSFALRTEVGVDLGVVVIKQMPKDKMEYLTIPNISLEPRWYYNLDKRIGKGKSVKNNSGNFFTVKLNYHPDTYLTSTNNELRLLNQFGIFPKWGIRRVYGEHLTFETGFGVGPIIYFGKSNNVSKGDDVDVDIHLRFGYTF